MFNNYCVSVLEVPFVCRIMDSGTAKTRVCNLNLILNSSTVFMEKNCEFEWSSDNGGVLHKRIKNAAHNWESECCGAKMQKLTCYQKSPKLVQDNLKGNKMFEKYGELIVLGYNGSLPQGNRGRKRSKFELCRRRQPNGVKRSTYYTVETRRSSKAILDEMQHSITYTFAKNRAVIVEYILDENSDMFQIGRSPEASIDFVVLDTIPGNNSEDSKVVKCNVSRFACRILADRSTKNCRIYAAGFDTSRNIFLGRKHPDAVKKLQTLKEKNQKLKLKRPINSNNDDNCGPNQSKIRKTVTPFVRCATPGNKISTDRETAPKWQENDDIDGMTTNGILIMHPKGSFCSGEMKCGYDWWETSVTGKIFTQRESRSSQEKGQLLKENTNILEDGTLIYLSGATLLWRAAESLAQSPNKHDLKQEIDKITTLGPACLIGLKCLITNEIADSENQQPYLYLNCGHVEGIYEWEKKEKSETVTCPFCLKIGPVVEAHLGLETAFYVDCGPPTFAFNPCGHMTTEKTVKYWANVAIPHGTNGYHAVCPFCATPLAGAPGYIQLILQGKVA